jgi:sulfhydrogenase subunit alpha
MPLLMNLQKRVKNMSKEKKTKTRTIKVDYLTRLEGEGALYLKIKDKELLDVQLRIFEPPRFFEAFLQGRHFTEAPDITARICGICPVAYQMSAVHSLERACGVEVNDAIKQLRRLLYCAEWIESHTLHIYMLHAPDFLGFPDAMSMAKKHREEVERGLRIKKAGNSLLAAIGGREVHPINVKLGGFYRCPDKGDLLSLVEELKWARDASIKSLEWVSTFHFPDFTIDYEFVSLCHSEEYPMNEGFLGSNRGLKVPTSAFEEEIQEVHMPHSTALHALRKDGSSYLTGPMARFALNFECLSTKTKELAKEYKVLSPCTNPFRSIQVRCIEVFYALDEAIRIIENYKKPKEHAVEVKPRAGSGSAITEAPRGNLYHRYDIDEKGIIKYAKIVAPTSQNQRRIEEDLRILIKQQIDLGDDELTYNCEQAIRNYDPCISCSTHFLKLHVERE